MGLFDDIADVHTGAKTKKQVLSNPSTKAFYDSKKSHTSNTGKKQTGKQILDSADKHGTPLRDEAKNQGRTIRTQDEIVRDLPDPKKLPEDKDEDKKEVVTKKKEVIPEEEITFFKGFGNVTSQQSRIINKLRKKGLNDAAILMALKQGKFADENLIDLMSGEGLKKLFEGLVSKKSLFEKPDYEHEFLGSAGAANIIKKLQGLPPNEQQAYVDRIIKANPEGFQEMFGEYTTKVNPSEFINTLTSANTGNKNFDKIMNPEAYYSVNPPQTSGELREAYAAGVTHIPGFGPVERPEGQGGGISGLGGGGGGGALPPTDPVTDPTKVPDYVLKQQYMPGFTPDYSGGPEQMQIAGGYWDPVAKKWIGQGPWGTQSQYQFNQGGIVGTSPLLFKNQGGMVNDGGIKSFKKYGY